MRQISLQILCQKKYIDICIKINGLMGNYAEKLSNRLDGIQYFGFIG
jgi:hypothetical protein